MIQCFMNLFTIKLHFLKGFNGFCFLFVGTSSDLRSDAEAADAGEVRNQGIVNAITEAFAKCLPA